MDVNELAYWYWLTDVKGIGPVISKKLLNKFQKPINLYNATADDIIENTGIRKNVAANIMNAKDKIDRYYQLANNQTRIADELGGRILTANDIEYADIYKRHDGEKAIPALIHVLGDIPILGMKGYVIVGTRQPSEEGKKRASNLATNLARKGIIIISGLALGIDAQAHTSALDAGSPTIAILGCGADIRYPAANSSLYTRILSNGLIISEFPFGVRPSSENLRKRNRTIVSFSDGVIIAECPVKSGAMIAARFAVQQKKPLLSFTYESGVDNSGGDWLISKHLAERLDSCSVEAVADAVARFIVQDGSNADRIFREIWPQRRKPKVKEERQTNKKKKDSLKSNSEVTEKHTTKEIQQKLPIEPEYAPDERGSAIDTVPGQFEYKVGDEVIHQSFGKGTIQNISQAGDDYQLTIKFAPKKSKTLLWKYANLVRAR